MASTSPYHSLNAFSSVYHDSTLCKEGNKIEPIDKIYGTADRVKCFHCSKA